MDSRGKAFQTEETVLARFLCQRKKKKKKSGLLKEGGKGHWNKMRGKVIQN